VVSGVAAACKAAGMALLGGETAEMPGVYHPGELDLAGTVIGVVERETLVDGSRVLVGDTILAFPSSGLHTNGYSLARMALDGLDWTTPHGALGGQSIGEALLAVHRPYLSHVEKLWVEGIEIHGLAHITGGGLLDNLPRVLPDGIGAKVQRGTWPEPPIFGLIAQHTTATPYELFHAFNMGLGMLVIIPAADVDKALASLPGETYRVGEIVSGEKAVEIENLYG
jgi:phosphoribosylformylglycinamidine cyclo-ligase